MRPLILRHGVPCRPVGKKASRGRAHTDGQVHAHARTSLLKHSHAGAYVRAHAYRHARRRQPKSPNLKHIFTHYVSFDDRSRDRQDRPAACLSPKQNWFIPVFPSFQRGVFGAGRTVKTGKQEWDRPPPIPHQAKHEIALLNRQQTRRIIEKAAQHSRYPLRHSQAEKAPDR